MITYRQLREAINELDEDRLDMYVSTLDILQDDEFSLRNVKDMAYASEIDGLDEFIEDVVPVLVLF